MAIVAGLIICFAALLPRTGTHRQQCTSERAGGRTSCLEDAIAIKVSNPEDLVITATDFEVTIDFLGGCSVEPLSSEMDCTRFFLATRNSTSTMQRRTSRGRPGVFPRIRGFLPSERNASYK